MIDYFGQPISCRRVRRLTDIAQTGDYFFYNDAGRGGVRYLMIALPNLPSLTSFTVCDLNTQQHSVYSEYPLTLDNSIGAAHCHCRVLRGAIRSLDTNL